MSYIIEKGRNGLGADMYCVQAVGIKGWGLLAKWSKRTIRGVARECYCAQGRPGATSLDFSEKFKNPKF